MAFALKLKRVDRKEIDRRVRQAARILHLTELLHRKPRQLSGGQRQRVAMGRAIVREPQAFLMDEPLSNLDAKLRVQMRAEIARIQRGLDVTTIYVTHDQVEAMTMGDRVAVLRQGELQQVDTPQRLYDGPANLFVAEFIGSPAMNVVEASLQRDDGLVARFGQSSLAVDERLLEARPALAAYEGRKILLGFRPEHLEDSSLVRDAGARQRIRARCDLREALGSEILLHFALDAPAVVLEDALVTDDYQEAGPGENLSGDEARMVARVNPKSRAREGEWIELAVDTVQLHFFDPQTERAIHGDRASDDSGRREGGPPARSEVPAPPGTAG
jgi:multiple sugar transport system ATP-binding protein